MKVKEIIKKLESNSEFKEWKKKNKRDYLVHLFTMFDDKTKAIWQIGYANKDSKVTTFVIEEDLKIIPDEEVFQQTKRDIKKLELDKIKLSLEAALEKAKEFQEKKYKGNEPLKTMVVIQNIANSILYNITYITTTFNTLNMKIDAINGKMIRHEITPMLQFRGKSS